ncbi:TetR/AcrR family transcriptional regulator [Agromyces sp. SYSU T00194]|uniref:TetR/AcrR family transcriptional regulator n=1 Tax=Agromyces chitinivorans TaxID=3158560 RepID=UPI00339513BB
MPRSTSRARAPRADAAANRDALLTAAATTLATDPDASLEQIAQAAGLSRRAVYGHFQGRDELVAATLEEGALRLVGVTADLGDDLDERIAVATIAARLWASVAHVRLAAGLALREPYVHRIAGALAPLRARVEQLVRRGAANGTLRADLPAETVAHLVERSAIAVLAEANRTGMDDAEGHRLVMLAALGAAGLSWRESADLIDATPSLAPGAAGTPGADASPEAPAR